MQHDYNEADEYEEPVEHGRGNRILGWFREALSPSRAEDDEMLDEEEAVDHDAVARLAQPSRAAGGSNVPLRRAPGAPALRLETARRTRVTVRRTVQSFEDVRRAVDGLREGTQQIVNLEQTPVDMAERLIDFMNGATYAIDGSVEKIGEHVYLFTPPSVSIDVEDRAATGARTPFFDKD
ncbi:MAG: cell division protein SepF [Capsulimonadaceae bacterium]|nr:cell division protein SepF [Capsulimonadaceae bacterium]